MTHKYLNRMLIAGSAILLFSGSMYAQEGSKVAFSLGGGYTQPVGTTATNLDHGWNVAGGLGWNFNSYVGALVDLSYNHTGINSTTLFNEGGFPGGEVNIFSATLDPIVHLTPGHHFDFYLTGGGGLYHMTQEFTQPGVAGFVGYDPFFGFYNGTVSTTQVLASYTVNKPGFDAGAGIEVGTKWHGKLFAEARYNHMFLDNGRHVDWIPVTFGLRW